MDGTAIFPHGFNPATLIQVPTGGRLAVYLPRYTAPKSVKYYFIDFGISSHFPPGQKDRLVTGEDGLDRSLPELATPQVPYDPFKVDVYLLGNFFKQTVLDASDDVRLWRIY